ncbi:acyclic terpene utilization AtuA family protein [Anaeropeptidivorans aminofermentans]|uniref:acyclic terpene utilization AtuA family protein n=1 Tax=Anaeropeptidivorans aminofermentans TaxID=2934315 RepID=UPI002024E465|nr:acyclic terpene utilization AtuA family protein [Anaeropeptidivorans aminofermentans]
MKKVRIGCGAGCCKDRIEPVEELIEKGALDYLVFETLAERSFANLQAQKKGDKTKGFNEMLEVRMRRTLKQAMEKNVKIITNMGGANISGAAEVIKSVAKELGLSIKIALVEGDDIFPNIERYMENERWQYPGETLAKLNGELYYANVYLGGEPIREALENGADIVVTGRIADAALFSGPLMYEFGWGRNHPNMGQATLVGHLLECCGQITGGFFADPGKKEVPGLERLGFPIAEVSEDGSFTVTKVEGSGGIVCVDTCKEQLLYEITDPTCYKTPDAIVDFSGVSFKEIEKDVVLVTGATSKGVPETLKVNVGYTDGFTATGIATFAGSNSLKLAELCADIIWKRLEIVGITPMDKRTDYVGYNALCKTATSDYYASEKHGEIMLRMSVRTKTEEEAKLFADEFGFLYTNGPAGSTGMDTKVSRSYTVTSIFIPASDVIATVRYEEVGL